MSPEQDAELRRWRCMDWESEGHHDLVSEDIVYAIGACGRSGTTLLRHMLGSHSQLADGPESQLFLPVAIDIHALSARFELPISLLTNLYLESKSRVRFIENFQRAYVRNRRRDIWIDKTSRNIHRFAFILKYFPNARVIHVIRDPRAVVNSLRRHPVYYRDGREGQTGWVNPTANCIERWRRAVEDCRPIRTDPRYIEVRYESLIEMPEMEMRRICYRLSLPFEPAMLSHENRRFDAQYSKYIPNNFLATKPLTKSRVDAWRKELAEEEYRTVCQELTGLAAEFGYSL